MDRATVEIAFEEQAIKNESDLEFRELNELQLVLVGGGFADTVL